MVCALADEGTRRSLTQDRPSLPHGRDRYRDGTTSQMRRGADGFATPERGTERGRKPSHWRGKECRNTLANREKRPAPEPKPHQTNIARSPTTPWIDVVHINGSSPRPPLSKLGRKHRAKSAQLRIYVRSKPSCARPSSGLPSLPTLSAATPYAATADYTQTCVVPERLAQYAPVLSNVPLHALASTPSPCMVRLHTFAGPP